VLSGSQEVHRRWHNSKEASLVLALSSSPLPSLPLVSLHCVVITFYCYCFCDRAASRFMLLHVRNHKRFRSSDMVFCILILLLCSLACSPIHCSRLFSRTTEAAFLASVWQVLANRGYFISETFSVFSILNHVIAILAKTTVGTHQKVIAFFFKPQQCISLVHWILWLTTTILF